MFPGVNANGLSLTKILSGISKTLNVANQLIPLYTQAKPMINNAKNILAVLKAVNNKSENATIINKNNVLKKGDYNQKTERNSDYRPVFFS